MAGESDRDRRRADFPGGPAASRRGVPLDIAEAVAAMSAHLSACENRLGLVDLRPVFPPRSSTSMEQA